MTSSTAEAERPALASPWSGRFVAALPLLTVFAWLALVYAWEAWLVTTPVIFTDELLYAQLSRSFADTGHAALRGAPHSIGSLAVAARAPAWLIADTESAYLVAKLIGVAAMTAAAFPTYALARLLTGPRPALFAAVGTVAIPSLAYSTLLLEEPIAYPVAALAFFLGVLALGRPSRATIAAAVACALVAPFVRGELVVVPLILVVAALALGWASERVAPRRRRFRPWDRAVPVAACAVGALVGYAVLRRSVEWQIATDHPGRIVDQAVSAAGAFTIGLGIVPVIAALAALARPAGAPRTRERRAFVAVFAAAVPAFLLYTGAKGAWLATILDSRVLERNVIYLAPLVFVGTALWLDRPRARPLAVLVAAGIALVLVLAAPIELGYPYFEAPGYALAAFANRELTMTASAIRDVLVVVVALAAAAMLLARRLPALAAAVAVAALVWNVSGEVYAALGLRDFSQRLSGYVADPPDWVDEATGRRRALFLGLGLTDPNPFYSLEFWNRSVAPVWTLDRSVFGPGETGFPTLDPRDGRVLPEAGIDYAVIDSRLAIVGRKLAVSGPFAVYRVARPLRLREYVSGVYRDGWMGSYSTYDRYSAATRGHIEVTVGRIGWGGRDVPSPVIIRVRRITPAAALGAPTAERRWTVHSRTQRVFRLPAPRPPFRVEIGVARSFVPAELDPTTGDGRSLGAQVAYRFVPNPG